jgi:hypothetical protein
MLELLVGALSGVVGADLKEWNGRIFDTYFMRTILCFALSLSHALLPFVSSGYLGR